MYKEVKQLSEGPSAFVQIAAENPNRKKGRETKIGRESERERKTKELCSHFYTAKCAGR